MSDFPTKILLATDGSEDSMLAAISLAEDTGVELHVVHRRTRNGGKSGIRRKV
jgi:hypothetical protein